VEGSTVRLSDLRGRAVVLNFWAFWCDTWKAEMPHLRRLAEHRRELRFEIVAVSVDGTRVQTYRAAEPRGAPFAVALDHGGAVSRAYGVTRVPTVLVLDAQGRVRYRASGYPGNQPILSALRRLSAP
jgi:peroxiredoxin